MPETVRHGPSSAARRHTGRRTAPNVRSALLDDRGVRVQLVEQEALRVRLRAPRAVEVVGLLVGQRVAVADELRLVDDDVAGELGDLVDEPLAAVVTGGVPLGACDAAEV